MNSSGKTQQEQELVVDRVQVMECSSMPRFSSSIFFIQISDAGVYECVAKNRAGEIRKRFIIEPYGTPRRHSSGLRSILPLLFFSPTDDSSEE